MVVMLGAIMTDQQIRDSPPTPDDLLRTAWALITQSGGGDWKNETADWQMAAEHYRRAYFRYLDHKRKISPEG